MVDVEYAANEERKGTGSGRWVLAARQSALARQQERKARREERTRTEEMNERLRNLVNRGR